MGKTIIQTIGPLYGEVVNGTVFGRPNGSIYVPITNTIKINGSSTIYVRTINDTRILWARTALNFVAESQDLASNMEITTYSDAELTQEIAVRSFPAGSFNLTTGNIGNMLSEDPLISEATYYMVARLVNNGVSVATSETLEVVAE